MRADSDDRNGRTWHPHPPVSPTAERVGEELGLADDLQECDRSLTSRESNYRLRELLYLERLGK